MIVILILSFCRLSFLFYAHQISVLSSHFTSVCSTASAILLQQPLNFISSRKRMSGSRNETTVVSVASFPVPGPAVGALLPYESLPCETNPPPNLATKQYYPL